VLSKLQLTGRSLSVAASGRIAELGGRCLVELEGQIGYDLEKLVSQLGPPLSGRMQFLGRDTRPFSFRGPLFGEASPAGSAEVVIRQASTRGAAPERPANRLALDEMSAKASFAWRSANITGFLIGPGEMEAELSQGVVSVSPLETPASEGRIRLAPRLVLRRTPVVLTLPGSAAEQVRLSPEMCRGWLKYVAPLVADATAAEGRLSVSLDTAVIPLAQPSSGDVRGVLTVHSARIGPGPLSREFLWMAEQVKALMRRQPPRPESAGSTRWLEIPAQEVAFQMADQRIYHQGLRFAVNDVIIRTRGSVGFDQSLSLIAEIPILDQWVANDRYLAALRGHVLELPIRGTLKGPNVDERALARLTRQTVTGAATRLLEQELNRGLERLLQPRE
jgi:hypothetical protein